MNLERIKYQLLNPKAKEMYNFQKVSAVLADFGYTTMWLNNDWKGADFIAIHVDGTTDIRIQLKGRFTFNKDYRDKNIFVCFIDGNKEVYLYPHDTVLSLIKDKISDKKWKEKGKWSCGKLSKWAKEALDDYKIGKVC